MKDARKLTEGALLLAIYVILLLINLYIPFLRSVLNFFLTVPFILFAARNEWKNTIVFFMGAFMLSFFVGSLIALPFTVSYGLTGLVMGIFIHNQKSREEGFLVSFLVFLLTIVLQYFIAVSFFQIDIVKTVFEAMDQSISQVEQLLLSIGQSEEMVSNQIQLFSEGLEIMRTLVPSIFVVIALTFVFIIQLISIPIVKRFGIQVSNWTNFRDISLPKSLIWYYLITILISSFIPLQEGTYWYSAVVNIAFILQILMAIQGISFLFFYANIKKISKAVPIVITILLFLLPFLLQLAGILGIIDLGFDMKKRLAKS
ncbi:YybS family protein [Bacillaceae bacterium Marseille-Q3522]|nr:YybS family protein [Bacillaceae bacterium Marseille-Q3522]